MTLTSLLGGFHTGLPIDRPIIATRIVDVECGQQVNAREMTWTGQSAVNRPIDLFLNGFAVFLGEVTIGRLTEEGSR